MTPLRQGLRRDLLTYFRAHPRRTYAVDALAKTYGTTEKQIRTAMGYLVRSGQLPGLTVVTRGRAWKYRGANNAPTQAETPPPADKRDARHNAGAPLGLHIGQTLEVIGHQEADGRIVVRSVTGTLYRLEAL